MIMMSSSSRKRRPSMLKAGVLGLVLVLTVAILAPLIYGTSADVGDGPLRAGPSLDYLLGTDAQGRDNLQRTLVATRLSVYMAAAATLIAVVIGVALGAGVAVSGARIGWLGNRLIDLLVSWPPIIIALSVTAILRPSASTVMVAVGLAFSPQFARLTNTLATSITRREFVTTARLLGVQNLGLLRRHVLPNIAAPILVLISACSATSLITMSGLSFVGLGVQAPSYDWGSLLAAGLRNLYSTPSEVVGPTVAIVFTGLMAGLVGDGLAKAGEPRQPITPQESPPRDHPEIPAEQILAENAVAQVNDLAVFPTGSPGQPLVRGVSFAIAPSEIVGIVGESGSGKTLTAMAIAQLTPTELSWEASVLEVAGHQVRHDDQAPKQLALDLGVVFQDPASCFNPARRLGPQLVEVIRVHQGIGRKQANELAIERLTEARVSDPRRRMHQYPHELSGGMRQRAMIAMALLSHPQLLVADEPTTALDVTVQADVLRLLKQVNNDHNMAILLISHDIDVVSAMCDRVLVMYQGVIVEELAVESLRRGEVTHPYTQSLLAASLRSGTRDPVDEPNKKSLKKADPR